jgi:hypothetical protein
MFRISLTGLAVVLAMGAVPAGAQTATSEPANSGAYASLPPGEQKIVDSIYASQSRTLQPGTGAAATSPTPLSKDDIAASKSGTGWGQVFKNMQAQGLVSEKNLGQAVSYDRHTARTGTVTSPASSRTTATSHQHKPLTVTYGNGVGSTISRHGTDHTTTQHGGNRPTTAMSRQGGSYHHTAPAATAIGHGGSSAAAKGGGGHGKSGK